MAKYKIRREKKFVSKNMTPTCQKCPAFSIFLGEYTTVQFDMAKCGNRTKKFRRSFLKSCPKSYGNINPIVKYETKVKCLVSKPRSALKI